jgi:hypothetical protein
MGVELDGTMRTADSPKSDSGATAYRARTRLQKFKSNGGLTSLETWRKPERKYLIAALILLILAIGINIFGH